jgi:alpha-amylase/alpha-mannosidase (GH57 family)
LTAYEVLDLQVWSNLVWSEPRFEVSGSQCLKVSEIEGVESSSKRGFRELAEKEWGFTEKDKERLFDAQQAVLRELLPAYRQAAESGSIELVTSPYYHPIMPLICDLASARRANSGNALGAIEFRHPEHAREQLRRGIARFQVAFGFEPTGLWSPEMALSSEALGVLNQAGVGWTLGNSDLLRKTMNAERGTMNDQGRANAQLSVYVCRGVKVVFRDRELSDRIGFVYANWDSDAAARDLIGRIKGRLQTAPGQPEGLLVIALDGENAWEYYPEGGWTFLDRFYQLLEAEAIPTTTISQYLKQAGEKDDLVELPDIAPGSWIDSDFEVWAGSRAHQKAWQEMATAVEQLGSAPAALDFLLAAECSDWYWWLSDRYRNPQSETFARLFHANLRMAYRSAGLQVPSS